MTAMITLYGRCGKLSEARELFEQQQQQQQQIQLRQTITKTTDNEVSLWNVLISSYMQQKEYSEVIKLFERLKQLGSSKPEERTLRLL
jgi:pentatricopeptide repeat protein